VVVLVPSVLKKKLDAATLDKLAELQRADPVSYFVTTDGQVDSRLLNKSENLENVYVGRSSVEELFLLLQEDRVLSVQISRKYYPIYR
jgi:hypothetical protein